MQQSIQATNKADRNGEEVTYMKKRQRKREKNDGSETTAYFR